MFFIFDVVADEIKDILKKEIQAKLNGKIWLESGNERFFGPGPMELLERIDETGSISSAAKEMKMSYKKAWDLINHLNACTTTPLVIPHAGGEKGGGSILTSEARALIAYYRSIQREFTAFLEKENRKLGF